ncbi:MAG: response regulator transcription factor [Chloroflexota bacterium]
MHESCRQIMPLAWLARDLHQQAEMAQMRKVVPPNPTVTTAHRILVVDDTPALLDVIRACLEQEGYRVRTCLEARNAAQMARLERPDVIMLDVFMPEVSGWEVLADIRADASFRHTPVIVCTAFVAEAMGRLAELKGPDQHLGLLPKPFELEELIEVVGSVSSAAASQG